jgi:hypothetical protein
MKKLITLLIVIAAGTNLFAQDNTTNTDSKETDETMVIENETDTSYYEVGKKKVEIIERNDSTFVKVWDEDVDIDEDAFEKMLDEDGFEFEFENENPKKFRGHWAGFEFGLNNYVDKDGSLNRTPENEFMDISTNRSWNFNLNFAQFSFPVGTDYAGFVTGLGLEWSNYHFSSTNTIIKNTETQQIESVNLNRDLIMNRFQTTYLTVPLLFEVQFSMLPVKTGCILPVVLLAE